MWDDLELKGVVLHLNSVNMRQSSKLLFYIFTLSLIFFCSLFLCFDYNGSYGFLILLNFVQLFWFFVISNKSRNNALAGHYIRPFYIFLFASIIVNFQGVFDYLLGYKYSILYEWGITSYNEECFFLGVIAQCSCTLGYISNVKKYQYRSSKNKYISTSTINILSILSLIVLIGFVLTINLIDFISGEDYKNSGGHDRESGTINLYLELMLGFLIAFIISFYSYKAQKGEQSLWHFIKGFPVIFLITYVIYLSLRMISGDRGPVIYNLAIMFFGYLYVTKKKYKFAFIFSIFIVASISLTILGVARSQAVSLSFGEKIENAFVSFYSEEKESILPMTKELSRAVRSTAISIEGIEDGSIKKGYGLYNGTALITSIPFLGRLINVLFPFINLNEYNTSEVVTIKALGKNYTYGLGATAIAEPYMDFGILGVVLIFFIGGYCFKKIDYCLLTLKNIPIITLTFMLIIASYSVYIPRSSFMGVLSYTITGIIILSLMLLALNFLYTIVHSTSISQRSIRSI